MMKMKTTLLAAALAAFAITGCQKENSDSVKQDKIYSAYLLTYDKSTDQTMVAATYKFSNAFGTTLELNAPAKVTFNNDLLAFNSLAGSHIRQYPGYVRSGSFSYTDHDSKTTVNNAQIRATIDFPDHFDSIPQSGYTFTWKGDSLGSGEYVTLRLTGTDPSDYQEYRQSNLHAKNMVLAADQLALMTPGTMTVEVERHADASLQNSTSAGGSMQTSYKVKKTIRLVH